MRDYELMYIIAPSFGNDEDCAGFAEQFEATITNNGGTITAANPAATPSPLTGRRKLAYAIRRELKDVTEGYYVLLQFQAEPTALTEIERVLKLADPVMRYLITLPRPEPVKADDQ